jgi:Uma2 family endonuclease
MVTSKPQASNAIGFETYLHYSDGTDTAYELVDGSLVEMPPPTWMHMLIAKFLVQVLDQAIASVGQDHQWTTLATPGQRTGEASSRLPDVAIVPFDAIDSVMNSAVLTEPAPLVVEIVSHNWQDDYLIKLAEYEALGIPEYWIIDYRGLGGTRYIGQPKQPTISVYSYVDGEYQVTLFRQGELIKSPTFPELVLSADDIFSAGKPALLQRFFQDRKGEP